MKISAYNRLQALARKPEYIKDYREICTQPFVPGKEQSWSCTHDQEKITAFKNKWGLDEYHSPEAIKEMSKKQNLASYSVQAILPKKYMGISLAPFYIANKEAEFSKDELKKLLCNGRYLTLKIDLSADLEKVKNAINICLSRYKEIFIEGDKSRKGEMTMNPWHVYDMKQDEGKTFLQIAREKERDEYREKALKEQARRAYKKAIKMIEEVDK